MKKLAIITVLSVTAFIMSCGGKNDPGRAYMPDMGTSRAYETYADHSNLADSNIHYTAAPVPGTIARGEEMPFHLVLDKAGDSTNYVASKQVSNPIAALSPADEKEAERLYLINCGICHGVKLDGNGPLYKGGDGPYKAAPKNLMTLAMPEGQMFYSVTYGKGMMGSYASQLSRKQRWQVIRYIKNKQTGTAAPTAPAADTTATAATK
jgi:mono/diheme cytochrome c family protein